MRDYTRIDSYLNQLAADIYPQPEGDDQHGKLAKKVIDHWLSRMTTCKSVLDVGCGEAFCQPLFEWWNVAYEGVALGDDFINAKEKGRNVKQMDFTFLDYPDRSFDMVFSRHSLEHSPMPVLTLMEWHRVARSWLGLIMPTPEWYTYVGLNHYSVANSEQISAWADRAGWKVLWHDVDYRPFVEDDLGSTKAHEYWFVFEKKSI